MTEAASSYDQLPYAHAAFAWAHPDRLAVVGALHGIEPTPVERSAVLDLGCALGGNLIPMAAVLPDSRFLGVDLSAAQIEQGRTVVERLGLTNVQLRQQDLMDFGDRDGPFDYILCHGVYSWVPLAVQDRILSICKRSLAPRGLAMISYNVQPGWHFKGAVRDILRYGARGARGAAEQVARALEFLGFVARSAFEPDSPYGRTVRAAAESLATADPTYVFHEYLEDCNSPVSFEQFTGRAAAAGLRHVADASLADPSALLTDEARRELTASEQDVVRCEQTLDFLRRQSFRRAVLCHDALDVRRWPQPEALKDMLLVARAEPIAAEPAAGPDAVEQFRNARGHTLSTADPALKAALRLLCNARPRGVAFAELVAHCTARSLAVAAPGGGLARSLLGCAMASLVELHTHLPPIAGRPRERPQAAAVARWQAADGQLVVNLRHECYQLDALSRAVLAMLDGRRDRRAVADEIRTQLSSGRLTLDAGPEAPQPAPPPAEIPRIVDEVLTALAGLSLLIDSTD